MANNKKKTIVISLLLLFAFSIFIVTSTHLKANAKQTKVRQITAKSFNGSIANKDKSISDFISSKDLDINLETLPVNAKKTKEKLMTYEQFINEYNPFMASPDNMFSKGRMVWVVEVQYPNGIQTNRGFAKNAMVTYRYDAETGTYLGSYTRSLDPDGMNDVKPPKIK